MQIASKASDERECPICGSRSQAHFANERIEPRKFNEFTFSSRKHPEFMCLRLVRCTDCDLVYAPSPPTKNFLSRAYTQAAYDSGPEAQAAAQSYAQALAPHIQYLTGRNAAVDVGAGSGPLLPWLCTCGFDPVIGIEPSHSAIEAAEPAVRPLLREGMFSKDLLANITPSLLCSFMTLEHLADPGEFIHTAYDLIEPGGMLAIVVHNWRAHINRLLGLRSPIIDVEHLQLFSPRSLHTLLEKQGFMAIKLQSISNTYPLRYWLRLTPLPIGLKNILADALSRIGLSDFQISLPVGNILAVGIKPEKDKQL